MTDHTDVDRATAPEPDGPHARSLHAMAAEVEKMLRAGGPLRRVSLEDGPTRLEVEWYPAATEAPAPPPVPGAAPEEDPGQTASEITIAAPLVGTFYAAAGPDEAPYASVGDLVRAGQQVGIVEAMKLMNPVSAPADGRVLRIVVSDGEAVEYDQPLILLTGPDTDEEEPCSTP